MHLCVKMTYLYPIDTHEARGFVRLVRVYPKKTRLLQKKISSRSACTSTVN